MENLVQITNREFAQMTEEIKSNTKIVDELIHLLRGNGNPGLLIRVDRLEFATDCLPELAKNAMRAAERMDVAESHIKEIRDFIRDVKRGLWSFVFLFIVFISGLVWSLWTHQIEIIMK